MMDNECKNGHIGDDKQFLMYFIKLGLALPLDSKIFSIWWLIDMMFEEDGVNWSMRTNLSTVVVFIISHSSFYFESIIEFPIDGIKDENGGNLPSHEMVEIQLFMVQEI